MSIKKIEEAKRLLKESGYYIDNLWHVDDVQQRCYCTEEEAQDVLDVSLNNEGTMHQVWESIDTAIEEHELPKQLTVLGI
ncbi:hypothetical protein N9Q25_00400 [bacterium]|jgi:hypothetical protein|nr:hypothetical protein [bacterium]